MPSRAIPSVSAAMWVLPTSAFPTPISFRRSPGVGSPAFRGMPLVVVHRSAVRLFPAPTPRTP